jgi:2-methylisocitrate lyase-like PEP mutase family enzyme
MSHSEIKKTWNELLNSEEPLILPVAHDALSARLIEQAGFKAYSIGGFPLVGSRYGLPDLGLVGFSEMRDGIRDIMNATKLPVLLDADDGYGDSKNVTRTVRTYESFGATALFIEDQVSPKRCGHMVGKSVIDAETMVRKIHAAVEAKTNPNTFLIARTDSRAVLGLDEALRRSEKYIKAGADGIFIESPQSVEELEQIGRSFDVPQMANMLEGGDTPMLSPTKLYEMGFDMVAYPVTLLFRVVETMQNTLKNLHKNNLAEAHPGVSFEEYKNVVGIQEWEAIDQKFGN